MSERVVNSRRRYDNRGRQQQAAATRRRVLETAHRLVLEHGYAATTMAGIAAEAGVSTVSLYKGFGTKAELITQMLGMVLVGDDEPVPLAQRPENADLVAETDGARLLQRYAAWCRRLYERLGALPAILLIGARSGETDLQELAAQVSAKRLADATDTADQLVATGHLRPGLDRNRVRDLIWALNSPEMHQLLTRDREWSPEDYQHWLAQALTDALIADDPSSRHDPPTP